MPKRKFSQVSSQSKTTDGKPPQDSNFSEDALIVPYEDALDELLIEQAAEILPDWDIKHMVALLAHLMKNGSDEDSIRKFTEKYRIGDYDEILQRVEQLRKVNRRAYDRRFRITPESLEKYGNQPPSTSKITNIPSSNVAALDQITAVAKDRRYSDLSQLALPSIFRKFSKTAKIEERTICRDEFVKSNKYVADINYKIIYDYLANFLDSRSITRVHSMEAAVLLSIFDELDKTIQENFPELIQACKEVLSNLPKMEAKDFHQPGVLTTENVGEHSINVLGMPNELLDLNQFSSDVLQRE